MPPFRLELPHPKPLSRSINKRIIYTKNEYIPAVKVSDWNYHEISLPYDHDPYCPGNLDYTMSHYNRLGDFPDDSFRTTTTDMLEQIHTKDDKKYNIPIRKYLVNFFSYYELDPCFNLDEEKFCPDEATYICANDYCTSMQESYKPPYPYVMKRLSCKNPPFLKYRKLTMGDPKLSDSKCWDEDFTSYAQKLQKHKWERHISFNPLLGIMSNGEPCPEKVRKCVKLGYDEIEPSLKCYYKPQTDQPIPN